MGIKLYNFGDFDVTINKGVAVAQFAIYEIITANVEFTDTVQETDRGTKGFGSTGV
jgi:dUTP pyrophosphatase